MDIPQNNNTDIKAWPWSTEIPLTGHRISSRCLAGIMGDEIPCILKDAKKSGRASRLGDKFALGDGRKFKILPRYFKDDDDPKHLGQS